MDTLEGNSDEIAYTLRSTSHQNGKFESVGRLPPCWYNVQPETHEKNVAFRSGRSGPCSTHNANPITAQPGRRSTHTW